MESGWWRNSLMSGTTTTIGHGSGGDDVKNNIWDDDQDDDNIISTNHQLTPPFSFSSAAGGGGGGWKTHPATIASTRVPEESATSLIRSLLFNTNNTSFHHRIQQPADPHMICLKLGKRHYCEDAVVPTHGQYRQLTPENIIESASCVTKRAGKQQIAYGDVSTTAAATGGMTCTAQWPPAASSSSSSSTARVARCQVEGCQVVLGNTTKEYYRRHKVCEIHSKSPKVVVLGLLQRFCQQCSRFHRVTEFDEAKRSCRRRLEGHNQRRRKGSISHSLPQNFPQYSRENSSMMERRLRPSLPESNPGCALSLLSSPETEPWISPDDLSSRCSEALYELIAANRATAVVAHRLNQDSFHQSGVKNAMHGTLPETQMWDGIGHDTDHTAMTLERKQATALNFGLSSVKEKAKNPEEWTDYCLSAFGGSNASDI